MYQTNQTNIKISNNNALRTHQDKFKFKGLAKQDCVTDLRVSKFTQKNQFFWAYVFRVCLDQEIQIHGIEKEHKDVKLKQEL